jgi:protocatechuate 3,4-dioxygenase beta subunit
MSISRRSFVKSGSLWIAAAAAGFDLVGCKEMATSAGRQAPATASQPPAAGDATPAPNQAPYGYASSSPPPSAPAPTTTAQCTRTAPNIEGPYYRPGAPMRSDLVDPAMQGTRLVVSGRVVGDDCSSPLENAMIDVWQADADGHYDNDQLAGHRTPGPLFLRGKLATAKGGAYEVKTIIPGRYLNGAQYRPSHVHVKVSAPGYRTLTTQLYFEGDPYNDVDPFIDKSLIMKLKSGASAKLATFDFVLVRA